MLSRNELNRMIQAGAGKAPADVVVRNVRRLDVIRRGAVEDVVCVNARDRPGVSFRHVSNGEVHGRFLHRSAAAQAR